MDHLKLPKVTDDYLKEIMGRTGKPLKRSKEEQESVELEWWRRG